MEEINYYSSWPMPIAEKQAQLFAGIRRISGANFDQLYCFFGKALAKTFVSLGSVVQTVDDNDVIRAKCGFYCRGK